MCAAAGDAPAVEHEDLIRVQDRAQALRHDEHRRVVRLPGQGLPQRGVGLIVERGEAVVKQIHLRVLGDGARDRQALPLPAGDVRPALRHRRKEMLRPRPDEVLGLRGGGGADGVRLRDIAGELEV